MTVVMILSSRTVAIRKLLILETSKIGLMVLYTEFIFTQLILRLK